MSPKRSGRGAPASPALGRAVRIDGRGLSHSALAAIRRLSIRRVLAGDSPASVMERFGLCRTTIYRWLRAMKAHGVGALERRKHPGRAPKVSLEQALEVRSWILDHTPAEQGLASVLWTRAGVATLIRRRLGLSLTPMGAGRLLRRMGLAPRAGAPPAACRESRRLLFAVDGRGSFLCTGFEDDPPAGRLASAMGSLSAAAGRRVTFHGAAGV